MEKMTGETLNITNENIKMIAEHFPEAMEEGKIKFDVLKELLGEFVDEANERYQFTWNGKSQALKLSQTPSTGTLLPRKEKSKNWDATENLYIEGDNLEVLKLLQKSYYRKIKMIYIDPPYNTGNDFVYKDDFKDNIKNYKKITNQVNKANAEVQGRYHTDWLNMIYPRLRLAKNLLKEDGVIFISIDDNEQANLRKICDEIFGEANFIGVFCINSTPNARDYGHIGKMHEYVLFYAKNIELTSTNMIPEEDKKFKYEDNHGGFNIHPLYNSNEAFTNKNRPNLYYPFYVNPNKKDENGFFEIGLEKKDGWIEVYPPKSVKNGVQFVWRWGKEEKARENLNKEIVAYNVDGEFRIVQKMRNNAKLVRSFLSDKNYTSRKGTAEVEELMGEKIFSFPKPIELIKLFEIVGLEKEDVVLDFFAGSATTAHALIELNKKDNGNRKFILVQLPEKIEHEKYFNLCELAEERICRAIKQNNSNTGFKVFKLDSSNLKLWNGEFNTEEEANNYFLEHLSPLVDGRTNEDLLYELLLKEGMPLTSPIEEIKVGDKTIYSIGMGYLMICLEDKIDMNLVEEIGKRKPESIIFRDSGFADENAKINTIQELKKFGIAEEVIKSI